LVVFCLPQRIVVLQVFYNLLWHNDFGDIANNVVADDGSNSVQNIDNLLQTNESNINDNLIIEQINDESLSCYHGRWQRSIKEIL